MFVIVFLLLFFSWKVSTRRLTPTSVQILLMLQRNTRNRPPRNAGTRPNLRYNNVKIKWLPAKRHSLPNLRLKPKHKRRPVLLPTMHSINSGLLQQYTLNAVFLFYFHINNIKYNSYVLWINTFNVLIE